MGLKFSGGIKPDIQSKILSSQFLKTVGKCRVGFSVGEGTVLAVPVGTAVKKGTLLARNGSEPLYSSVAGIFEGVYKINGNTYLTVKNNGEKDETAVLAPETKPLTEMDAEYIAEKAKKLAVFDSRSGRPLYEMINSALSKNVTLVIDCTEPDPRSASSYRLCLEKNFSAIGGAKMLIKALSANGCIFAAESSRKDIFDPIKIVINDKKLFSFYFLDTRYPYTDHSFVQSICVKNLPKNETPEDKGIFIVGIEAAVALYDAFLTGMPSLERYISVTGEDGKGFNLIVPKGISTEALVSSAKLKGENKITVENSLISGTAAKRFLSEGVRAVLSAENNKKNAFECVYCGKCVDACPVGLMPFNAVSEKDKSLYEYCIGCGCCEYICPSNIPLLKMIKNIGEEKV